MAGPHKPFLLDYPLDIIEDVGLLYDTQYSTVQSVSVPSFRPFFLRCVPKEQSKHTCLYSRTTRSVDLLEAIGRLIYHTYHTVEWMIFFLDEWCVCVALLFLLISLALAPVLFQRYRPLFSMFVVFYCLHVGVNAAVRRPNRHTDFTTCCLRPSFCILL